MAGSQCRETGFTLVELMVVVLILGILVSIAVPIYTEARETVEATSCLANQRTISGAVDTMIAAGIDTSSASEGVFGPGGSGWFPLLVWSGGDGWVKSQPTCPQGRSAYYMTAAGAVIGDNNDTSPIGFKEGHRLP